MAVFSARHDTATVRRVEASVFAFGVSAWCRRFSPALREFNLLLGVTTKVFFIVFIDMEQW